MNISPVATDLIEAIENYIEASNRNNYRFTIEEQAKLERAIMILNKHIDFLVQYENKKERV